MPLNFIQMPRVSSRLGNLTSLEADTFHKSRQYAAKPARLSRHFFSCFLDRENLSVIESKSTKSIFFQTSFQNFILGKAAVFFIIGLILHSLSLCAAAQVASASPTLPPEPAPPGASSLTTYQDPYQAPGNSSRPLLSNPPSNPFNSLKFGDGDSTKLFQNFGVDFTWITASSSRKNMGLFRLDLCGDMAIPLFASQENPFLFEPRFAMNYWSGPKSDQYDMAAHTFDASLGLRWLPKFQLAQMATPLNFDLFFSIGIYSDFKKISGSSFRFPSWGYLSLDVTNNIKAKIGIWYLDRVRNKIFPSGGVIWSPNDQWEFQILFPNPRVTYRPPGATLKDMSVFARGEYGGGSWSVSHEQFGNCQTDYNDYRLLFGIDWKGRANGQGFFELGVAFARELYLARGGSYDLDPGFIMQAGFHF
ncbi:MAG: hypothetical protein Q4D17_11015 [Planctomycetia bacterium]|nr:hypothetical protein [Planctomycetia bacterium]